MSSAKLSVAIVGAGMSGLTLACVLQRNGVSCTVYEAEADLNSRDQGGSLDMHRESGMRALELCGLLDQFYANCRPEGDDFQFAGKDGIVVSNMSGGGAPAKLSEDPKNWGRDIRPEIDRKVLRDILLESLQPGTVVWNAKVTSFDPNPTQPRLTFANGDSISADIVVGADGAWSRVRTALSEEKPSYTGLTLIDMTINDIDNKYPELGMFLGSGLFGAFDINKVMFAQRNSGGRFRNYVILRVPLDWSKTCGIPWSVPSSARRMILDLLPDWAPQLRQTIEVCADQITPRPIYYMPVGFKWAHRNGITVIGDAAHLMSPLAGEGANLAMVDGAELGLAIASNKHAPPSMLHAAIAKFEKKMWKRGAIAAAETRTNEGNFVSDGGLERALKNMPGPPTLTTMALSAAAAIAFAVAAFQAYRILSKR